VCGVMLVRCMSWEVSLCVGRFECCFGQNKTSTRNAEVNDDKCQSLNEITSVMELSEILSN
jgi:hypothetical protein